jgi:hypothetical protein
MSRSNALLHAHRRAERSLLAGHVREVKQFNLGGPDVFRWDFAYRDPASGRMVQYTTQVYVEANEPHFDERVREPAIACLAMMIQRKCGIKEALANQRQLELPRNVPGRFV